MESLVAIVRPSPSIVWWNGNERIVDQRKEEDLMERLKKGDRVVQPGLKFKQELDRHGVVASEYEGKQTSAGVREQMLSVRWDDNGIEEFGYLQGGQLKREPLNIATARNM